MLVQVECDLEFFFDFLRCCVQLDLCHNPKAVVGIFSQLCSGPTNSELGVGFENSEYPILDDNFQSCVCQVWSLNILISHADQWHLVDSAGRIPRLRIINVQLKHQKHVSCINHQERRSERRDTQ